MWGTWWSCLVTEGSHKHSHLVLACWLDLELREVRGGGSGCGNVGTVAVSAIRQVSGGGRGITECWPLLCQRLVHTDMASFFLLILLKCLRLEATLTLHLEVKNRETVQSVPSENLGRRAEFLRQADPTAFFAFPKCTKARWVTPCTKAL